MQLAIHVADNTAPKSMPVTASTVGCTTMMYDIAAKVVAPAITSRRMVVRFPVRSKNLRQLIDCMEKSQSGPRF